MEKSDNTGPKMPDDQQELRRCVQTIADKAEDDSELLTPWEWDFIGDMLAWNGDYTPKQVAIIDRIWRKI